MKYALNKVGVKALIAAESYRSTNYYEMIKQIVPELESSYAGNIVSSKVPSLSAVIMKSNSGNKLQYQFSNVHLPLGKLTILSIPEELFRTKN